MIDDLDGDFASFGRVERIALCRVESFPGGFVDPGMRCPFETLAWIAGTVEVGVLNEEAFAIVVGVDEPAGNVVSGGANPSARPCHAQSFLHFIKCQSYSSIA